MKMLLFVFVVIGLLAVGLMYACDNAAQFDDDDNGVSE